MNNKGKGIRDFEDIIGNISGRLEVTLYICSESIGESNNKRHWYGCKCECGNEHIVSRKSILKREVLSCGCLNSDNVKKRFKDYRNNSDSRQLHLKSLYSANSNKATYRGLEFTLDKDYHDELVESNCHYCGVEPSNTFKRTWADGELKYSGIDRIDSSQGYVDGNVVPCCIFCNRAKMDMPYQDFKDYIRRLVSFNS